MLGETMHPIITEDGGSKVISGEITSHNQSHNLTMSGACPSRTITNGEPANLSKIIGETKIPTITTTHGEIKEAAGISHRINSETKEATKEATNGVLQTPINNNQISINSILFSKEYSRDQVSREHKATLKETNGVLSHQTTTNGEISLLLLTTNGEGIPKLPILITKGQETPKLPILIYQIPIKVGEITLIPSQITISSTPTLSTNLPSITITSPLLLSNSTGKEITPAWTCPSSSLEECRVYSTSQIRTIKAETPIRCDCRRL